MGRETLDGDLDDERARAARRFVDRDAVLEAARERSPPLHRAAAERASHDRPVDFGCAGRRLGAMLASDRDDAERRVVRAVDHELRAVALEDRRPGARALEHRARLLDARRVARIALGHRLLEGHALHPGERIDRRRIRLRFILDRCLARLRRINAGFLVRTARNHEGREDQNCPVRSPHPFLRNAAPGAERTVSARVPSTPVVALENDPVRRAGSQ